MNICKCGEKVANGSLCAACWAKKDRPTPMATGGMVCEHGQLPRQCPLCEKDAEIVGLRTRLLAAEGAACFPPKGHVIDDAGNVRKVLGTLPVTADGCVLCPEFVAFVPKDGGGIQEVAYDKYIWPHNDYHVQSWRHGEVYSTKEAAEKALTERTP